MIGIRDRKDDFEQPDRYDGIFKKHKVRKALRTRSEKLKSILKKFVFDMYMRDTDSMNVPPIFRAYRELHGSYIPDKRTYMPLEAEEPVKNKSRSLILIDKSASMIEFLNVAMFIVLYINYILHELGIKNEILIAFADTNSYYVFNKDAYYDYGSISDIRSAVITGDIVSALISAFQIVGADGKEVRVLKPGDYCTKLDFFTYGSTILSNAFKISYDIMNETNLDYLLFISDMMIAEFDTGELSQFEIMLRDFSNLWVSVCCDIPYSLRRRFFPSGSKIREYIDAHSIMNSLSEVDLRVEKCS